MIPSMRLRLYIMFVHVWSTIVALHFYLRRYSDKLYSVNEERSSRKEIKDADERG